jgi:hypothetical protein
MRCIKITEFCEAHDGEKELKGIREIIIPFDKVEIDVVKGISYLDYAHNDILRSYDDFDGECQSSMVISHEVIEF